MRSAKSSGSFSRGADGDQGKVTGRPRRRSSLDTFRIPGRTRLPSSKASVPEVDDLRITKGLLNSGSFVVPPNAGPKMARPVSWLTAEHDNLLGTDEDFTLARKKIKVSGLNI